MPATILVIDDDRLNTTLIKFGLKEDNYEVLTASDGQEGLELVKAAAPDLIILDVQMPNMSGFEFIGELKTLAGARTIPVIMLTANETMQDVFFSEGVKDYFVKPVNLPQLKTKVKALLAG